jgi:hypothetical protein
MSQASADTMATILGAASLWKGGGKAAEVDCAMASVELGQYWKGSFGDGVRVDYGTGHEASFLMWLFGLFQAGVMSGEDDLRECATAVIPTYLSVVARLIHEYSLEPAGSHGAWSLDDYQYVPFLLGAAQLKGHSNVKPKSALNEDVVEWGVRDYLFLRAMETVKRTKVGSSFAEMAPLLHDICLIESWDRVSKGLLSMFEEEILGKFPVAQHFLFGSLLSAQEWSDAAVEEHRIACVRRQKMIAGECSPHESDEEAAKATVPAPLKGLALLTAMRRTDDADPFLKHFGQRRPNAAKKPQVGAFPGRSSGHLSHSSSTAGQPPMPTPFPSKGNNVETKGSQAKVAHELLKGGSGIKIGGWELKSQKRHMSSQSEIEGMEHFGIDFSVPEMIFGSNSMQLINEACAVNITFNAVDALKRCRLDADVKGREVLQLPIADQWERRTKGLPDNVKVHTKEYHYDWTYTTDYKGTWEMGGAREMNSKDGSFLRHLEGIVVSPLFLFTFVIT